MSTSTEFYIDANKAQIKMFKNFFKFFFFKCYQVNYFSFNFYRVFNILESVIFNPVNMSQKSYKYFILDNATYINPTKVSISQ